MSLSKSSKTYMEAFAEVAGGYSFFLLGGRSILMNVLPSAYGSCGSFVHDLTSSNIAITPFIVVTKNNRNRKTGAKSVNKLAGEDDKNFGS